MSRYHKKIVPDANGLIDLYAIAEAFGVKSNPQFHAMKKIMMAGERGHKSLVQDIDEAIIAARRWKEMVQAGLVRPVQFNCPPLCSKCHTLHHVNESCSVGELRSLPGYGVRKDSQPGVAQIIGLPAPLIASACPNCGEEHGCRCLVDGGPA